MVEFRERLDGPKAILVLNRYYGANATSFPAIDRLDEKGPGCRGDDAAGVLHFHVLEKSAREHFSSRKTAGNARNPHRHHAATEAPADHREHQVLRAPATASPKRPGARRGHHWLPITGSMPLDRVGRHGSPRDRQLEASRIRLEGGKARVKCAFSATPSF